MPRILRTPRLLLRPFLESDVEAAFRVLETDPEVWQYDPGYARSFAERAQIISDYARGNESDGIGALAIIAPDTKELMGYVGLQLAVLPGPEYAQAEVELFYKLGRAFWGMGFAFEACQATLRFAFDEMRLKQVVAVTHRDNQRSLLLLAKLNMVITAHSPYPDSLLALGMRI